ncbi:MAG: hypothetical protein FWG78_01045 [Coriobacteriia bacterium]|nr:hypothetical protein [Coriobacteriia bacterium]
MMHAIARKAKIFLALLLHPHSLKQILAGQLYEAKEEYYAHHDFLTTEAFYYSIRRRLEARYRMRLGVGMANLSHPTLYSEKIQWRKLYCPQVKLIAKVTDKAGVYGYVCEKIGDTHLLPLVWKGSTFDADTLRALGDNIVLQPTHRSGQVAFIEKAEYIDYEALAHLLHRMLLWPYSMRGQEPWYGRIKAQIIARPLIRNSDGSAFLNDYKFHMFRQADGTRKVVCAITNIYPRWRILVDENFTSLPFEWNPTVYEHLKEAPDKPDNFDAMLEDACRLSEDFDCVRVDFMMGADEYYFTELTFAPASGLAFFSPPEYDKIVGSYWHLDTGNPLKRAFWFCRAWLPLWKTERPMRNLRRLYRYRNDWAITGIRQKDYDRRYQEGGEFFDG